MQIYNSEILFNKSTNDLNSLELHECEEISVYKKYHSLEFSNNQDREISLYSNEKFTSSNSFTHYIFVVKDVVSFSWHNNESKMCYQLHKNGTQKLLEYWLSHTLYPMYSILKNKHYILHVGAVTYNDSPLIFMARSYGGKSTLTDYFLKQGHKLITDDKLLTYEENNDFYAIASYPFHRPYREMETLGVAVKNFEKNVLKLKNAYVLKKVSADDAVVISEIKGIQKFKSLRYATEMDFEFLFEYNTKYALKLSDTIKVYEVCVPWSLERLCDVYEKIIEHQKNLSQEKKC